VGEELREVEKQKVMMKLKQSLKEKLVWELASFV